MADAFVIWWWCAVTIVSRCTKPGPFHVTTIPRTAHTLCVWYVIRELNTASDDKINTPGLPYTWKQKQEGTSVINRLREGNMQHLQQPWRMMERQYANKDDKYQTKLTAGFASAPIDMIEAIHTSEKDSTTSPRVCAFWTGWIRLQFEQHANLCIYIRLQRSRRAIELSFVPCNDVAIVLRVMISFSVG